MQSILMVVVVVIVAIGLAIAYDISRRPTCEADEFLIRDVWQGYICVRGHR